MEDLHVGIHICMCVAISKTIEKALSGYPAGKFLKLVIEVGCFFDSDSSLTMTGNG